MRRTAVGVALAGAYVLTALVTFRAGVVPVRPLYEGVAIPPPYRWVKPPEGAATREPPGKGTREVPLTDTGSGQATMATDEVQAYVVFPKDAIQPKAGETSARGEIVPLDPAKLPAPPKGLHLDGNAYTATMSYAAGNDPVKLTKPVQVVLQYPVDATRVLKLSGKRWTVLPTETVPRSMQVFANSAGLGTFAAASTAEPASGRGVPWWTWLVVIAAFALAIAAGRTRRIRRRPPTRQAKRKQQRGRERG